MFVNELAINIIFTRKICRHLKSRRCSIGYVWSIHTGKIKSPHVNKSWGLNRGECFYHPTSFKYGQCFFGYRCRVLIIYLVPPMTGKRFAMALRSLRSALICMCALRLFRKNEHQMTIASAHICHFLLLNCTMFFGWIVRQKCLIRRWLNFMRRIMNGLEWVTFVN